MNRKKVTQSHKNPLEATICLRTCHQIFVVSIDYEKWLEQKLRTVLKNGIYSLYGIDITYPIDNHFNGVLFIFRGRFIFARNFMQNILVSIRDAEQKNVHHQCSGAHRAVRPQQPQRINLAQHRRHNDNGQRYNAIQHLMLHKVVTNEHKIWNENKPQLNSLETVQCNCGRSITIEK